jgi:hypothetical protein
MCSQVFKPRVLILGLFAQGMYIGIGMCGVTDAQRGQPSPFLLEGPDRKCQGDFG